MTYYYAHAVQNRNAARVPEARVRGGGGGGGGLRIQFVVTAKR